MRLVRTPGDQIGTACWDDALDLETEPEKWRLLWAALNSRKPFRDFVYRSMGGNGSPMYVKASGKPVFDGNGEFRGYRGTGADVTAAMRAQEEHERLRQLESDLAHMNRLSMMGELAASLAHEITQPIGSARNNARAALNFLDRTLRPGRGQGSARNVSWATPIEPETSSTGSGLTSKRRLRERIISISMRRSPR